MLQKESMGLNTPTVVETYQLFIPVQATSSSSLTEGGRQQLSMFSKRFILINCHNDGKRSCELLFNLDQGMDVKLFLEGNMDTKSLLFFYKQKIILLENQSTFPLKQNNFLQHHTDQNNKIKLKILNNNSQVESNLQNFNNILQKSDKKNPLVEAVKKI